MKNKMKAIIPCEECLVRPVCRKNNAIYVCCLKLYDTLVFNQNKIIKPKLNKIDEVFGISKRSWKKNPWFSTPNDTIIIYRVKGVHNSRITYGYNNFNRRLIEIENPLKPNIVHLEYMGFKTWRKEI